MHTLKETAVEKVANDLREELAMVTTEEARDTTSGSLNGKSEPVAQIAQRVSTLEESVDRQGRVIKRAIEIAASYFQSDRS